MSAILTLFGVPTFLGMLKVLLAMRVDDSLAFPRPKAYPTHSGTLLRACSRHSLDAVSPQAARDQGWQTPRHKSAGLGPDNSCNCCDPLRGVFEKHIYAWHRSCEECRRLEQIPGVGPIVATALVAEVGDWKEFSSGRGLAAYIGLVPKQHSTGGKERLGRISKQGNRYLRWLLVTGAMAVIRYARQHGTRRLWLVRIMERRPIKVAAVALANRIARMAWAMMVRGERFKGPGWLPAAA